jgi:hypothetical protein
VAGNPFAVNPDESVPEVGRRNTRLCQKNSPWLLNRFHVSPIVFDENCRKNG